MYTTQYNYFHDRPINEFDTKFYKISLNERKLIQVKSYKTLCFEIFHKNTVTVLPKDFSCKYIQGDIFNINSDF